MVNSVSILATAVDPQGGLRVEVVTDAGFPLAFDAAEAGAAQSAPSPTETVLAALAGCTSMDVASILRKKRQRATSYEIAVTGEKAEEHPRVYTRIVIEHRVAGDVEPEALRRSIELSATRYCPVSAMLSHAVTIEHGYRLRRDGRDEVAALVAVTGPEGARVV